MDHLPGISRAARAIGRRPRAGLHCRARRRRRGHPERQAECPFRAFAEFRLGSKSLESGEIGIAAADRGSAAHRALELLWAKLESYDHFIALPPDQLERIAAECARLALSRDAARQSAFQRRFLEMEQDRLKRLLLDWLHLERDRRPFTVVSQERKRTYEIGGILIDARIDRVDHLADGRDIIIDYKSTAPSITAWNDERPDEPQVPFYAISHNAKIGAVAFGQLMPGDLRFKGLASDADLLTGVKPSDELEQLINDWRPRLENLANEFREGIAAVDPKRGHKTCATCRLDALCRIRDVAPHTREDDANGA